MEVLSTPEDVVIRDLLIQDKMSRASIDLTLRKSVVDLKFSGELNDKTLQGMLQGNELPARWMKGNLQARIRLDQPWLSTADGDLEGRDIHFTLKQIDRVDIDRVSLEAAKSNVRINSASFRWKDKPFSFNGVASVSPKGIEFDMDLATQSVEFDTVSQALWGKDQRKGAETTGSTRTPPIKGMIRLKTDQFSFGGYTWMPLHANVSFDNEGVSIQALRGSVCGVSTLGSLRISDQGMEMEARPFALNQELEPLLLCFSDKKTDITGVFTLNGKVKSKAKDQDILRSLQGRCAVHGP